MKYLFADVFKRAMKLKEKNLHPIQAGTEDKEEDKLNCIRIFPTSQDLPLEHWLSGRYNGLYRP